MYKLTYTIHPTRFQPRQSEQTIQINTEEDKEAWLIYLADKAKRQPVTFNIIRIK